MAKHYKWQDDYSTASDKLAVLREFVSQAVHVIHEDIMENDKKLEDVLKNADIVARRIASTNCEFDDGWKLHKTWFRCGFLQLALHGVYTNDWSGGDSICQQLEFVYKNLGWDFQGARFPKATGVMTTTKLDFFKGYDDEGGKLYGKFTTLLVPIAKYPYGSLYESSRYIEWELCDTLIDGRFLMAAETKDKYGNTKYREMKMTHKDLNRMKRVL